MAYIQKLKLYTKFRLLISAKKFALSEFQLLLLPLLLTLSNEEILTSAFFLEQYVDTSIGF